MAVLATQKAVRLRLVDTPTVAALVPAAAILDVNHRPAPVPSIIIGEGQALGHQRIDRRDLRVFLDLHIWQREPGLAGVKAIAEAVRRALRLPLPPVDECQFGDCRVSAMRFLRDPDGETAHGVVTVEAFVVEAF